MEVIPSHKHLLYHKEPNKLISNIDHSIISNLLDQIEVSAIAKTPRISETGFLKDINPIKGVEVGISRPVQIFKWFDPHVLLQPALDGRSDHVLWS